MNRTPPGRVDHGTGVSDPTTGEPVVHVELELPVHGHVCPAQWGHPAVVLDGEDVTTGYLLLRVVSAHGVR